MQVPQATGGHANIAYMPALCIIGMGQLPSIALSLKGKKGTLLMGFADGGANHFLIGSPEKTEHELNNEFPVYYV